MPSGGNLITWKVNNTVIFSYNNTNAVAVTATNGTIMVGYDDPWDDVGNGSPGSGEGCAIIDNLKVVQLSTPTVLTGPSNVVADIGGTATLTVTASTVTGVTNYQWFTNGVAIAGATGSSYTVNPTTVASYTSVFTVSVSDGAYSTLSGGAIISPATGPAVLVPPGNLAAVVGGSPTFSVTAKTSTGLTNYQWQYYGTNVTGATASTYTVAHVQPSGFGGPYTVIVGDTFTTVTSTPAATLTVATSPTITAFAGSTNFSLSYNSQLGPQYVVDFKTNLTDAV